MKSIFTFIITTILFSFNAIAQQNATQLLEEVDAKVKSYKNIVIEFNYGLNNTEANLQQETRGDVFLEGEKYVLNLMGSTQLFDVKKLYAINDEDEEITVSTPEGENEFSPSKMLSFYKDGYKASMDIVQNIKGRKIQYVKLIPNEKSDEVKSVLLGIDKITKHIYKLIITQYNGTKVSIEVTQFKTNQPLSDTLFSFDTEKYKGYYINNLD